MGDIADIHMAVLCRAIRDTFKECTGHHYFPGLAEDVAKQQNISAIDVEHFANAFVTFLQRNTTTEFREQIASGALDLARQHWDYIQSFYCQRDPGTADYLEYILRSNNRLPAQEPSVSEGTQRLFDEWDKSHFIGHAHKFVRTGIYQVFRRDKPDRAVLTPELPDDTDQLASRIKKHLLEQGKQFVIAELVYLDAQSKQCILISSERKVYTGSLHVNDARNAFILFHQKDADLASSEFRFFATKLQGPAPFYSGISIWVGETSQKPMAGECLTVDVLPADHPQLYEEFRHIIGANPPQRIANDSVIAEYIISSPSPRRTAETTARWTRHIADFPFLKTFVATIYDGLPQFQEPIRALDNERIFGLAAEVNESGPALPVFRHGHPPNSDAG